MIYTAKNTAVTKSHRSPSKLHCWQVWRNESTRTREWAKIWWISGESNCPYCNGSIAVIISAQIRQDKKSIMRYAGNPSSRAEIPRDNLSLVVLSKPSMWWDSTMSIPEPIRRLTNKHEAPSTLVLRKRSEAAHDNAVSLSPWSDTPTRQMPILTHCHNKIAHTTAINSILFW